MYVRTNSDAEFNYGENVKIIGNLKYKLLSSSRQIFSIENPEINLNDSSANSFLAVVNFVRQQISETFYEFLPSDLAGLLLGIVIGLKTNFSPQFLNSLRLSGVMHVVAASGMNVTMVGGFFFYSFSLFLKRQQAVTISILAILFYAFLAGFQPSIIRACIMGIILFLSQILGRQNYSFYALVVALLIMLLLWPNFLVDVGFQLSFMATLGLLFIPRALGRIRDFASGDLVATLSAQATSLPILVANFGSYSVWSVVVNVLVLWTIPPLMVLGGIAAIISLVLAPFAKYILWLALPLLSFFEKVVMFFAGLPGVMRLNSVSWYLTAGYYLLLLAFVSFRLRSKTSNSPWLKPE